MTEKKKKISFEEALKELEEIAEGLERGQMTLEESIQSYEKGMELKKICSERLKEAEGKIEVLSRAEDKKEKKDQKKDIKSEEDEILF